LVKDGITRSPQNNGKQQAGRPKVRRIRNRSKYEEPEEESRIVCSLCNQRGHNRKTCVAQKELAKAKLTNNPLSQLDL
jgi:hypothetical protein